MNENVNVCVTPKGEKPILHFSQFDNGRIFTVTVLADDGETAAVLTDLDIEFRLRKTDSHVVTVAPESVTDNVITFKTTEQMCACCGQNIASVVLMDDDTNIISTLDILVDIQRDILSGGLTSESDIRNLTTQIEQIVPEVIGDDYYTKTEVDELIADIPTFDPSNYYDKSDVDGLLADKADIDDVMVKITRHGMIGDMSYLSFNNNCIAPMDDIKCAVEYVQSGSGTPAPDNVRPITGHSSCTITVSDSDNTPVNTVTVSFGQDIYGGEVDVTGGKVTKDKGFITCDGSENWQVSGSGSGAIFYLTIPDMESGLNLDGISNYIKTFAGSTAELCIRFGYNSNIIFIYSGTTLTGVTDLASFKTYLSSNPLELCYPLATPADITFTPATTDTINGMNKVSSSTGNMKSLTYFSDVNSNLVDLIRACMI